MNKYQWLSDYRQLENDISLLEFNLEKNKRELKRYIDGDLVKVKLTAESNGAKLEEVIEAYEWELAHKMDDLYELKKLVSTFAGIEHQIIKGKYVEGKTLERIAEDIGYSTSYIKKRHAEIVRTIHFIDAYSNAIR